MKEKEVSFSYKARYFKLGEITASTKQVWFVLHGYGQLARYFLKKFNVLEQYGICVIAPEGLSRFYHEQPEAGGRKNNRVGATWMTRENRLMDIENYLRFLDTVYRQEVNHDTIPITVLGFSQGAATASRWVSNGNIEFNRLVLWAGIFPADMDFDAGSLILETKQVWMIYGKKDPFLSDDRFNEMNALAEKLNTKVKEIVFDGEHDIDEQTLLKLLKK
jgi:predicted esterase